jgi:uncharacterized membrane protein YqjE
MPALKAASGAALRTPLMLVPFWTIRVLLIILLWPVADLVRMTAVTLACLMIGGRVRGIGQIDPAKSCE